MHLKLRRGVTLIEMLVAFAVASLVFVSISSIMVTFINTGAKSQQQELFDQTKNDLALDISGRVRWADTVEITDNTLTVDGETYSLVDGTVMKNGEIMTGSEVEITGFEVNNYSGDTSYPSVELTISMRLRNLPTVQDNLRLVVSQRKTDLSKL